MENENVVVVTPPVSDLLNCSFHMSENSPSGPGSANLKINIRELGEIKNEGTASIRMVLGYYLDLCRSKDPQDHYMELRLEIRSTVPVGEDGGREAIDSAASSAYALAVTVANVLLPLSSQQRLPLPSIDTRSIVENYLASHPEVVGDAVRPQE